MTSFDSLFKKIRTLSIEAQNDLHNFLENHLAAMGCLEFHDLTDDQVVIIDDRLKQIRKGKEKLISHKKFLQTLKKKYPTLNFKARKDLIPTKIIESILLLSKEQKLLLYTYLQPAKDAEFQSFLKEFNMTEEQWDKMNEEAHIHFSAQYKREADEIRKRNGNG